ncbi:Zein-binding domain containing protein [Trema orientale]|uniref:Zein-binding domain containing protein n=1 Tax=Trema orientale TaxID=63057 RepID=A0A2P5EKS7_TREOI|nr:Zein-binding domain containing protein [Trema orientale]
MAKRSFCRFVEQELGKFPHFVVYAVLEWFLILLLFVDGFLAFFANEFAKFFDLRIPCLFCTRIDHVLVHRNHDFYYNESVCEAHRKDVSSLAYCHYHKKLSDIRRMCEACLLSFATEKESDCGTYKSLVGILHKDLDCFVEDDHHHIHLSLPAPIAKEEGVQIEKSDILRCSCCGEFLKTKTKSSSYPKGRQALSFSQAPAPSPRAPFLPHGRCTELKLLSENESGLLEDENGSQAISSDSQLRDDVRAAMAPLLTEADELNDDANKTPNFIRGNRFFGIPLDSAANSPRFGVKISRKSPLEKTEFASESLEGSAQNEVDIDSILHGLKRQVRLDRKSLMALYMELDEERSASAVAANNAMAMITRLQAEKAAVQMEALQYQRMMEEQFEYDQEALQETNDMLIKREEDVKVLEAELEAYREKYGSLKEEGLNGCQVEAGGDYQEETKAQSYSTLSVRTESGSSRFSLNEEEANGVFGRNPDQSVSSLGENGGGEIIDESSLKDFKEEKVYFLGRRKLDKKNHLSENGVHSLQSSTHGEIENI